MLTQYGFNPPYTGFPGYGFNRGSFVPSDIPQSEADALIDFWISQGYPTLTNWGVSTTVNDWEGVTVTAGHVTALKLPNKSLNADGGTTLDPLALVLVTLDLGQNSSGLDLDTSALTALTSVDLADCGWGITTVAGFLADRVTAGQSSGSIDVGGTNSSPNPSGVTSLQTLEDAGVTVTYSTVLKITAGSFYFITADGDATIRSSATDLSGQTDKYIVAYDSANDKYAEAYGYQADSALTKGANLAPTSCCTDPDDDQDNTTGWSSANGALLDSVAGGNTGNCLEVKENGTSYPYALNTAAVEVGALYYFDSYYKQGTGTAVRAQMYNGSGYVFTLIETAGATWEQITPQYFTATTTVAQMVLRHQVTAGAGTTVLFDDTVLQKVTALGTDALQLRNAAAGSTRNWTDIESGFNPGSNGENIGTVEVFNV